MRNTLLGRSGLHVSSLALGTMGEAARSRLVLSVLERLYLGFLHVRPHLQRWLARGEARA